MKWFKFSQAISLILAHFYLAHTYLKPWAHNFFHHHNDPVGLVTDLTILFVAVSLRFYRGLPKYHPLMGTMDINFAHRLSSFPPAFIAFFYLFDSIQRGVIIDIVLCNFAFFHYFRHGLSHHHHHAIPTESAILHVIHNVVFAFFLLSEHHGRNWEKERAFIPGVLIFLIGSIGDAHVQVVDHAEHSSWYHVSVVGLSFMGGSFDLLTVCLCPLVLEMLLEIHDGAHHHSTNPHEIFDEAVRLVNLIPSTNSKTRSKLGALFCQAEFGKLPKNCNKGLKKAWQRVKNMSAEDARRRYVEIVEKELSSSKIEIPWLLRDHVKMKAH